MIEGLNRLNKQGLWRFTSDRRVYEVFGTATEDDKYLFTAASVDDAVAACERHNAIIGDGDA